MHGRPRKRAGDGGLQEQKDRAKVALLEPLQAQVLQYHHNRCYTKEALQKNAKLLEINPEMNTAWNYRKLALKHIMGSESDVEVHKALAKEEFRVIEMALARNIKSYGAWHHRTWVISLGLFPLENEFRLLDKLLEVDSRNFHAWDYRRYLAFFQGAGLRNELEFTRKKICDNFSNYSAWHNRSTLLSQLLKENEVDLKHSTLTSEFELVHQAFFTEPDDQSAWFYYNWLLNKTILAPEPKLLKIWPSDGLVLNIIEQSESSVSLCYKGIFGSEETISLERLPIHLIFSKPVSDVNALTVSVHLVPECGHALHGPWRSVSQKGRASNIWSSELDLLKGPEMKTNGYEAEYTVQIEIGSIQGIVSQDGHPFLGPVYSTFVARLRPVNVLSSSNNDVQEMDIDRKQNLKTGGDDWKHRKEQACQVEDLSIVETTWSDKLIKEEIELCRELLELENTSKWATLTLARLLEVQQTISGKGLTPFHNNLTEVMQLYEKLKTIDPSHVEYYCDRHSVNLLDQMTSNSSLIRERQSDLLDRSESGCATGLLQLKDLSLSKLGCMERLLSLQMLDLSCNRLQALDGLESLQLLVYLDVSHNLLSCAHTLKPICKLHRLRSLDVSYNILVETSTEDKSGVTVSVLWDLTSEGKISVPLSHSFEYLNNLSSVFKCMNLEELTIVGNPAASDNKFHLSLLESLPSLKKLDGESIL